MLNNSDSVAGDITCLSVCYIEHFTIVTRHTCLVWQTEVPSRSASLFLVRLDSNLHHCVCTADFVSLHSMSKSYLSVVDTWDKIKKGNLVWKRKTHIKSRVHLSFAFIFKLGVELELTQEVTEILLAQKVGQLEMLKSHHVHVVTCAFVVSTFSILEFNT